MPFVIFLVIIPLVIIGMVYAAKAAKKRREDMAVLAQRLGFSFSPDKDRSIDDRYKFLNALKQGSNRYAYNIMEGQYQGSDVMIFDFHYETHSTNSKGQRQTHHHQFSFFMLMLEKSFPELMITKEHIFSKIGQALGFDDIDFESHEFSRKYCVRSKDKKFAYDFCNGQMIEYLLANPDITIEVDQNVLALGTKGKLKVEQIEPNLSRMAKIRSLMPEYLFKSV